MNSEQDKFPEGSGNDAVLTSLSVQLNMTSQDPEFLKQKQFPVAMKPKNLIVSMAGHRISSNIASGRTSAARSLDFRKSIPRPRNKFIIARTMLSKLVKTGYSCNTDDKSKIISIVSCSIYFYEVVTDRYQALVSWGRCHAGVLQLPIIC